MRSMSAHLLVVGAFLAPACSALRLARSPPIVLCATPSVVPVTSTTEAAATGTPEPLVPPRDRDAMLNQAAVAVRAAQADDKSRFILRLFLPRGDDNALVPPDESWQGGIMREPFLHSMPACWWPLPAVHASNDATAYLSSYAPQMSEHRKSVLSRGRRCLTAAALDSPVIAELYAVCSPLVRELLRRLSTELAGVPPALNEQRLDPSGVDGESVWFAQSTQPKDDAVGLVQPSAERMDQIRQLSRDAGSRPLMLVNPQWKERDDPLDALSRKGGLLGALGNVLGGKAAMEEELRELGYTNVYTLAECMSHAIKPQGAGGSPPQPASPLRQPRAYPHDGRRCVVHPRCACSSPSLHPFSGRCLPRLSHLPPPRVPARMDGVVSQPK